jgi:hypothetical protein
MLRHDCTQLPDILDGVSAGRELDAPLAAHLASCPSCREQVEAIAFVRQLADTRDAPHPLPDPAVVWWKAQLLRRWQAERVASAPIERMHWVELAAGFTSLAIFVAWQWRGLAALLSRIVPTDFAAVSATTSTGNPLVPILIVGSTVSLAALFLAALHRRLSHTAP